MRRREFISLLGGRGAWPLAARAAAGQMRRIGVLMASAQSDPEAQAGSGRSEAGSASSA